MIVIETTREQRQLSGRIGWARSRFGPDSQQAREAIRDYEVSRLRQHLVQVLAEAPPSQRQRTELVQILLDGAA